MADTLPLCAFLPHDLWIKVSFHGKSAHFDKLYDKFTDLEKKTFLKSFLSDVFIYEEEQKDGRILKGLRFKFPIYMNGRNVLGVDWDNESTDETVVLLSKGIIDSQKVKVEMSLEDMDMSGFQ